jgi:histidyl-tRNA synthetase
MNLQTPQTLKGFRDFLPEEAIKRKWLRDKLCLIFEQWGYDPMETPTLEYLELFQGQIGEEEKLFFKFEDTGGRKVALRFDQTVPTSRVVAQYKNQLPFPFKRYQIQSAFRAEKPQKGRYREFVQCDADIFGVKSPYADAETIALSLDIYRQLGFPMAKVLISDRELLKNIPYEAIVEIDKLKKIGKDAVIKNMEDKNIPLSKAMEYYDFVKKLKPNEAVKIILAYLKQNGFDSEWFAFEPTIARSFSYSSGPIWEVEISNFSSGSVLGGERYDGLVEKISGYSIPATGFGLGFDRTLEAAEMFGLVPTLKTSVKVLVTIFSPALADKSLEIAAALRKNGVNTEIYSDPTVRLDKQLKYADRKGISYAIIAGPEEVKKDGFLLKNLQSKTQKFYQNIEDVKF